MSTETKKRKRAEYMDNAERYAFDICRDAELRGLSGYEVAVALASVFAARNPTMAGEVLAAVGIAIRLSPITRIINPQVEGELDHDVTPN